MEPFSHVSWAAILPEAVDNDSVFPPVPGHNSFEPLLLLIFLGDLQRVGDAESVKAATDREACSLRRRAVQDTLSPN
jgi:hypothetical protein